MVDCTNGIVQQKYRYLTHIYIFIYTKLIHELEV